MKRITLTLITILITSVFLAGCRNQSPIVVEKQTENIDEETANLVEESDQDEVIEKVEFQLKDEIITIHLEDIPIVQHYLAEHKDKQTAIDQMSLTPIKLSDKTLYLLSFAQNETVASYLLIDTTKQASSLIADQVELVEHLTLNSNTILFNFRQSLRNTNLFTHQLVAINTDKLSIAEFDVPSEQIDPKTLTKFTWPILDATLIEANHIQLTLPNVMEPTVDALTEWSQLETQPMQTIDVIID